MKQTLIDLSFPIPPVGQQGREPAAGRDKVITQEDGVSYTAREFDFRHDSMLGTYIDFPGHIVETDDGMDAATWPPDKLFRVEANVIHLDKPDRSGPVRAKELDDACSDSVGGGALIINALGKRRFDAIEDRSVWLDDSAISWIIDRGIHLFVSDIYESKGLHGVFGRLFSAGIATVCLPVNLHLLTTPTVKLTALPLCFSGVTQLPCRIIAEIIKSDL